MFIGANATGHTVDSYSLLKSDSERISKDSMVKIVVTLTIATVFATLLTLTLQGRRFSLVGSTNVVVTPNSNSFARLRQFYGPSNHYFNFKTHN